MKLAIGSDHAGYRLKEHLEQLLKSDGHDVIDYGTDTEESVDYPDFAARVGRAVAAGEADRGVLVCGSGNGMAMAANKVRGVRAAVADDVTSARSRLRAQRRQRVLLRCEVPRRADRR